MLRNSLQPTEKKLRIIQRLNSNCPASHSSQFSQKIRIPSVLCPCPASASPPTGTVSQTSGTVLQNDLLFGIRGCIITPREGMFD